MADVRLFRGARGRVEAVDGRECLVTARGDAGAAMYGPYEERSPGRYRVEFHLGRADDAKPLGDPVCALVDVVANEGKTPLARRWLLHSQLGRGLAVVGLEFTLREPRKLEYRVHSTGQVPLAVSGTARVTLIEDPGFRSLARTGQQRRWENEREFLDGYLRNVPGVLHVGANLGQERRYYWLLGVDVIWIEPIREIYEKLVDNIAPYPRQRAIGALLTDREGEEVEFEIANNSVSSSMLPLQDHAVIFPDIKYVERRRMAGTTLAALVRKEGIPLDRFPALTLDVEGAERLVLEGAGDLLAQFEYVKCEVADFPARTGAPTVGELDGILARAGFAQLARRQFAMGPNDEGTFWDVVWKRAVPGEPLHEPGVALPLVMDPQEVEGLEKSE